MGGGKGPDEVEETAEFRALIETATAEYADYEQNIKPLENIAIERALDTEGREQQLRGLTSADVYQRFNEVEPNVLQAIAGRGARLDSGAGQGALEGLYRDRSVALGQGLGTASTAALQDRAANAQRIVNMGQGVANQAVAGFGDLAGQAQRQAIMDAQASAASRAATQQLLGTAIGIGGSAYRNSLTPDMNYSGYGSLYTAPYQDTALNMPAPIQIAGGG